MPLYDNLLTIKEAREYLFLNGVDWSENWIRIQVATGRIPSEKVFHSRVIARGTLAKIVEETRARV